MVHTNNPIDVLLCILLKSSMNIMPSSIETTAMEGTNMVIMPIMLAIPSPPWNLVNTECQWPKIAA